MEKLAVLTHLYYEDTWDDLKKYLLHMDCSSTSFYFNLCVDKTHLQTQVHNIKRDLSKSIIIKTPNVGKDIGAKLALIHLLLLMNDDSEYTLLMHDKKSPHTSTGLEWRNDLLRIAEQPYLERVIAEFKSNRNIGIVASKKFIMNEFDADTGEFSCTSNAILKELKKKYSFKNKNHDFVGGTMFWVKSEILRQFFKRNSPLAIRAELEMGNVLDHENGSLAHAWERMLSWIVINEGYIIKGL